MLIVLLTLGKIMEWLSQNWIWLAFAVGMVVMMRRGGAGGGCCGGHGTHDKLAETEGAKPKDAGTGSCGGGEHGAAGKPAEIESAQPKPSPAGAGHHH